jgi:hypothetical protein
MKQVQVYTRRKYYALVPSPPESIEELTTHTDDLAGMKGRQLGEQCAKLSS